MKFIIKDANSIGHKRQQVQRACNSCRRKKRRCGHFGSTDTTLHRQSSKLGDSVMTHADPLVLDAEVNQESYSPSTVLAVEEISSSENHLPRNGSSTKTQDDDGHTQIRFIGDLNPESVFYYAISPGSTTRGAAIQESIGTWLAEKPGNREVRSILEDDVPRGIFYNSSFRIQRVLLPPIQDEVLSVLPSTSYCSHLITFYCDKMQPLLPSIDIKSFQTGTIDSKSKVLLTQAMCLLASMSPECKNLLYLSGDDNLLSPREFGKRILSAMRCIVEIGIVTNKMILIQALGSMSLFTEGPEGSEISTQLCAKMIQLVHTVGLQHQRTNAQTGTFDVTALCYAWALDRLNAAIHGRPTIMHERDIGRDLDKCFCEQVPAFRLLLHVILQLNNVIALYRPHSTGSEFQFPSFEDIIVQSEATDLTEGIIETAEVLYHAAAILSCRENSDANTWKSSKNHARQSLSAARITAIVGGSSGKNLVFLPFVPYAVSLSLSISYQQMRYTKVPMYQLRARHDVESACDLLDKLGEHFYAASSMAKLGKSTISEMNRVSDFVGDPRHSDIRKTQKDQAFNSSEGGMGAGVAPPGPVQISQDTMNQYNDPTNLNTQGTGYPSTTGSTDFRDVPDVDIFSMFDPNFGLEGVDNVFQSNLDLSTPMFFYGQVE